MSGSSHDIYLCGINVTRSHGFISLAICEWIDCCKATAAMISSHIVASSEGQLHN